MNKRIRKKAYKRAEKKLLEVHAKDRNFPKRSTLTIELEEHILTPLERKVFLREQYRDLALFDKVVEELKSEGLWN
jgi:hypothetical protein